MKWAGPSQFLYVDPAGEYVGDAWREKIQRDGICVRVSASESHWQLGRTEAPGKILKSMLTRMNSERPIVTEADFRQSLRAAVLGCAAGLVEVMTSIKKYKLVV